MSTEPITGLTYQEAGSLQTDALQNAELLLDGVHGPARQIEVAMLQDQFDQKVLETL